MRAERVPTGRYKAGAIIQERVLPRLLTLCACL